MAVSRLDLIEPTKIISQIVANAKIDGHTIRVDFDSGAGLSILQPSASARAGVTMNSVGTVNGGVTYGIYGKGMETFLAPFASFAIGNEEIKNTQLRVADIDLGGADMLLGPDFFLSHRILVSNSQKRVYFTYNGGPVFRLDRQGGQQTAQAGPPPPRPDSAVPTATAPAPAWSAAAWSRRLA